MTFEALEKRLRHHQFDFCFGDTPSLADVCLIPQIFNADRFHVPMADFPNLLRVNDNCKQLASFQKAHPTQQPDME
jgi:maleylpyruvate isomerase